ncbi:hypothetical protein pb186bvf_011209 [Paramecium bursaria]
MIISRQDLVFQLICKYCHQFTLNARVCMRCETIYCYDCLKQQPRTYHYNGKFSCECNINHCESLHCVEEYVKDQLKIRCVVCEDIKSINIIKKHEAQCHRKEQEALNYFYFNKKLSAVQQESQSILLCSNCKQIEFLQFYLNYKYHQQIVCKKCIYNQFYHKQYQLQMNEEQLLNFQAQLFQCQYCQKKENYFDIQSHNFVCSQQLIDCECGWSGRRFEFLEHFKTCACGELEKLYINLEQINLLEKILQFQYSKTVKEHFIIDDKISKVYEIVHECGFLTDITDFNSYEENNEENDQDNNEDANEENDQDNDEDNDEDIDQDNQEDQ